MGECRSIISNNRHFKEERSSLHNIIDKATWKFNLSIACSYLSLPAHQLGKRKGTRLIVYYKYHCYEEKLLIHSSAQGRWWGEFVGGVAPLDISPAQLGHFLEIIFSPASPH